mgnify:CR=1 FL=1
MGLGWSEASGLVDLRFRIEPAGLRELIVPNSVFGPCSVLEEMLFLAVNFGLHLFCSALCFSSAIS